MGYYIARPSPILAPYVKQYWAIDNCYSPGEGHIQRIVPNGLPEMSFYLEDKPVFLPENKIQNEGPVLSGQINGFYDINTRGHVNLFSVTFQPLGAVIFFHLPMKEISNQHIPLKYVFKDHVDELEYKLSESPDFSTKILILEQYLLKLLSAQKYTRETRRLEDTIQQINQNRGIIDISCLAERACWSRKQYERKFLELIGLTPKQFLKIIRFQNALFTRQKNQKMNLTELAYHCGYYDQSHMINDFKMLSGMTPGQYFEDCELHSDYFS